MAYNGWTNYQTWNVNLWIENDEGLYTFKREVLADMAGRDLPVDEQTVASFVADYMEGHTPDVPLNEMWQVNWREIADHWEEERQKIKEDK